MPTLGAAQSLYLIALSWGHPCVCVHRDINVCFCGWDTADECGWGKGGETHTYTLTHRMKPATVLSYWKTLWDGKTLTSISLGPAGRCKYFSRGSLSFKTLLVVSGSWESSGSSSFQIFQVCGLFDLMCWRLILYFHWGRWHKPIHGHSMMYFPGKIDVKNHFCISHSLVISTCREWVTF